MERLDKLSNDGGRPNINKKKLNYEKYIFIFYNSIKHYIFMLIKDFLIYIVPSEP